MLTYRLTDSDLGEVRFGVSPLCELGLSLKTLRAPARYPSQVPWLRRTREARERLDLDLLSELVDDRLWTPDFLTPRPESPLTGIDDELGELAAMPPSRFLGDIEAVRGTLPDVFRGPSARVMGRTIDALRVYWDGLFAPWWPRMRSVLQADIVHRGRRMAAAGTGGMLDELVEAVSFDGGDVRVRLRDPRDRTVAVAGRGLTLVPTLFSRGVTVPSADDGPPMILYSCRGHGVLWETERPATVEAVAGLLGATRTALLVALSDPASSTELAVRFDVTASAVNQHLRALRDGGLVTSTRYGRSVLYFRSPLGEALLGV